jgi:putative membrane protein
VVNQEYAKIKRQGTKTMSRVKVGVYVAAGAFFAISGVAAMAQQDAKMKMSPKKTTPITNRPNEVDRRFMTRAAQSNLAEVMTSQLALKRTNNQSVQRIAEMLIKEHGEANAQLKKVAAKNDFRLPTAPNKMQKAMYEKLSKLSGAAFDRAYMEGQIKAHLDTINLFQMEINSGRDGDVNLYAREYLPAIQNHTSMIVSTARSVGVRIPAAAEAYAKKQTSSNMNMNNRR